MEPDHIQSIKPEEQGRKTVKQLMSIIASCAITLTACSLNSPILSLSGKVNPTYTFHPTQQIYVALPEPPNNRDKQFQKILVKEMKHLGFNVTRQLSSNSLVLFFSQVSDSTAVLTLPNSSISRLPAQWHQVNLELHSLNELRHEGPIWEGTLKIRRKEFEARPADSTRALLALIGKNYEGSRPIQTVRQSPSKMNAMDMTQLQSQVQTLQGRVEELEGGQTKNNHRDFHAQPTNNLAPASDLVDDGAIHAQSSQGKRNHAHNSTETPVSAVVQQATEFYKHACADQDGKACTNLGLLYYQGMVVPHNLQRAQLYFSQGCRYHDKVACALQQSSP